MKLKHSLIALIVAIIIASTLALGTFNDFIEDDDSEETWWEHSTFHYEIEIAPNQTGNYTVIVPIPTISPYNNPRRGEPTQLMYELELIKGNATWGISNKTGVYGLVINASNHILIVGHREFHNPGLNDSDYIFRDLNMKTYGSNYSVYYNSSISEKARMNMSVFWRRNSTGGYLNYEWGIKDYLLDPTEIEGWCWYEVDLLIDKITADR